MDLNMYNRHWGIEKYEEDIPKHEPIDGTIESLKENEIINGSEKKKIMKELKEILKSLQITEKIKSLEKIKSHPKYLDIISKKPELRKYCGKAIYIFSVEKFPYYLDEITKKFKDNPQKSDNGKKFSLCRINKKSRQWDNVKSKENICLYVGR